MINYLASFRCLKKDNGHQEVLHLYIYFSFILFASLPLASRKNLFLDYFSCNPLIFK